MAKSSPVNKSGPVSAAFDKLITVEQWRRQDFILFYFIFISAQKFVIEEFVTLFL